MSPDDRQAFDDTLAELRKLGRQTLADASTEVLMHASYFSVTKPHEASAMIGASRLLYILAIEDQRG